MLAMEDFEGDLAVFGQNDGAKQLVLAKTADHRLGGDIIIVDHQDAEGLGSIHELTEEPASLRY
jgi:ABC-type sugar transport system substrate-binding protein